MAEDYRLAAYMIKGRILALREKHRCKQEDISNHLAKYWNIAPTGAGSWVRKLESDMLLEDMGDVTKHASRPEHFNTHQQRIFDYLAALGVSDEHSCMTILEGVERVCRGVKYQRSEVKPLSPLEKSVQSR